MGECKVQVAGGDDLGIHHDTDAFRHKCMYLE